MAQRVGGAFGIFDFFAYVVPGIVLLAPLLTLPVSPPGLGAGNAVVVSAVGTVLVYLTGLLVHSIGAWVERSLLSDGRPLPSRTILSEAQGPLRPPMDRLVRQRIVDDFGFDDAVPESLLWDTAYRWVTTVGPERRVHQFLLMSSMARGVSVAAFPWVLLFAVAAWYYWALWYALYAAAAVAAVVGFDRLRATFSRRMASEVYVAYFHGRRDEVTTPGTRP